MLEVIGAGVGRTGTLSLKTALERLGFGPCHHMLGLFGDPEQIPMWEAASRGEPVDWTQVYAKYRSTVDWPGARFWREIAEAFPEAKVVLTVRDPESWYASAASSIYPAAVAPPPADAGEGFLRLRDMSLELLWDGLFDGRFTDKEHALKIVAEHDAAVRQGIDADRLLVYQVSEGWEPLCEFLGVPVPDEPFPRSNERARFMDEVRERSAAADAAG